MCYEILPSFVLYTGKITADIDVEIKLEVQLLRNQVAKLVKEFNEFKKVVEATQHEIDAT